MGKVFKKIFNHQVFRFLFAGGTAAVVDLGLLYVLVQIFQMWYLVAAIIAFIAAFSVSFIMQKFMTFGEYSRERIPKQLTLYLIIALANLVLNTFFMYVQVDIMRFHYLVAQILASGVIALYSFFVYKHLVFHRIHHSDKMSDLV
ncbi:GtrA family protein [Patescibacteria group bacterium]|nr:MAG: GtrA family protein [Patescibacteria group bacterium]